MSFGNTNVYPQMRSSALSFRRSIPLLLAILLLAGCAGVQPDPRYNRQRDLPPAAEPVGSGTGAGELTALPRADTAPAGADNLDSIVEAWWGTPYRSGGMTRHGIDCSAYVQAVYKSVYNKKLPRHSTQQYATGRPVERGQLQRGDLVFFNTSGKGVSHVGIYLGGGHFTHASNSRGVTIDALADSYYAQRYIGARRVP